MPESPTSKSNPPTKKNRFLDEYVRSALRTGDDAAIGKAAGLASVTPEALKAAWKMEPDSEKEVDKAIFDPSDQLSIARSFIQIYYMLDKTYERKIHLYEGQFYSWNGSKYIVEGTQTIRSKIYELLDMAVVEESSRGSEKTYVPFKPNRHKVNNVLDAISALTGLPGSVVPPCWIDVGTGHSSRGASEFLPCKNGLLHLPTGKFSHNRPSFFCLNSSDYDYNPKATDPERWLKFLNQIWPDDPEAIFTLQRWFGYCLTPDTRLQKGLLVIGPKRSGKGTIGRILTSVLGVENVVSPSLNSLTGRFGLAPLVGRNLAIVSDARLSGRTDMAVVVERLLNITGQDMQTIDRKGISPLHQTLPSKIMLMTNELPRFNDASTALADRFIILKMTTSFADRIDPTLTDQLMTERASILKWAIDGWRDLWEIGHFDQPSSGNEVVEELTALSSPVTAFVKDCCVIGEDEEVDVTKLYSSWRDWCDDQGRTHPGTKAVFGRDLHAAIPGLSIHKRPRTYRGIGLNDGRESPGEGMGWGEV
jgi:putative DNA primase/helicase